MSFDETLIKNKVTWVNCEVKTSNNSTVFTNAIKNLKCREFKPI